MDIDYVNKDQLLLRNIFPNLVHINEELDVSPEDGIIEEFFDYSCSAGFKLIIRASRKFTVDITHFLPNVQRIQSLLLKCGSTPHTLTSLKNLKEITGIISIIDYNNDNIRLLKDIKFNNALVITSLDQVTDFDGAFQNINILNGLQISSSKAFDMTLALPNLKKVNRYFSLLRNDNLDVSTFDKLEIIPGINEDILPAEFFFDTTNYIRIERNTNMINCASDFICRSLAADETKVLITDNDDSCNRFDIIDACPSKTFDLASSYSISPNPFADQLTIEGHNIGKVSFFTLHGKLIKEISIDQKKSIISPDLPPGVYILRLYDKHDELIHTEKVVRM